MNGGTMRGARRNWFGAQAGMVIVCLWMTAAASRPSHGQEIGFVEQFALAADRTDALSQLIPGTEAYYYYHCLHYQNTEQFAEVEKLLPAWIQRHGETGGVQEIQHRQALLTYGDNSDKSLEFIRTRLGLNFNHQQQVLRDDPDLPTALDGRLISRETLLAQALRQHANTDGLEESALQWFVSQQLDPVRRRHLLERLTHPHYDGLPQLVVADINHPRSRGFGSMNVHRQLTRDQLDECARLKPGLKNETNFVAIYLTKLQPSPDVDWRNDPEAYRAYLDELWTFVSTLAPVHNSLKVNVLYHRLALDRSEDKYDPELFLTYIKLPRQASYVAEDYLRLDENRRYIANLQADYRNQNMLPIVGDDEPLIRSFLHHFFVEADDYRAFVRYIRDGYLKRHFAETKIVNGLGDQERWYSMLSPDEYQRLKERVDIDFAYTNKDYFAVDDPVSVELFVKNVETMIVKVFELNTRNYYRGEQREISTDINLDGLVANDERLESYGEPSLRRVARRYDFPGLTKPGVYVIDFIGNGKSSRVIVRKGRLRYVVRNSIAGHAFTVFTGRDEPLPAAVIWMAGREYTADDSGEILIPYSNAPGRRPIVLTHGGLSSLDFFNHLSESYALTAGVYVDREALLERSNATAVIRAGLKLNGNPVSLQLLEEPKLTLTATDLDGVSTTKEVREFELFDEKDSELEFQVPARTVRLDFHLTATVENVSQATKQTLSQSQTFLMSEIDRQAVVEDVHLSRSPAGYHLELLGKSGEPKPNRAVALQLKHRDFRQPAFVTLKTDEFGIIDLGELVDIANIQVTGPGGNAHSFPIDHDQARYPQIRHANVGEIITVPYLGDSDEVLASELGLLELRGGVYARDHFESLSLENGMIEVGPLPAGDYHLLLKPQNRRLLIRVTDGKSLTSFLVGKYRWLETRDAEPFHVGAVSREEDKLVIRTNNATADTRIHVFATSFAPSFSAFDSLGRIGDAEPFLIYGPRATSLYVSGRQIGDEYQYILDRRYATKYPGNMLERPTLLLNPWAIRDTSTGQQTAAAGGDFAPMSDPSASAAEGAGGERTQGQGFSDFSNLSFLKHPASVILNLVPDENGVLEVPVEALGPHFMIQVVGVDPSGTTTRRISLDAVPRESKDLRLAENLDPNQHFAQQKQISFLDEGDELTIEDITTSRFHAYSTLNDVYGLYLSLSGNPTLAEFAFVLQWAEKSPDDKKELYSKYACHELNFFLMHKDPDFFAEVIQPYLANKRDKTYLDLWLLEADVSDYRKPWRHQRMNIVERILLGQRVSDDGFTKRHIGELYALNPTSREQFDALFQVAIQGRSLDVGGDEDFEGVQERMLLDLAENLADGREWNRPSAAPQAPGAGGGFGGGGGRGRVGGNAGPGSRRLAQSGGQDADAGYAFDAPAEQGQAQAQNNLRAESESLRRAYGGRPADRFAEEQDKRNKMAQLYRQLDKTKEWAENNYYQLPIQNQVANLVGVNQFWHDYAQHDSDGPFFSIHFAQAKSNFTEMMMALAVLDLPIESPDFESMFEERRMTITAESPMIALHEEISPIRDELSNTPILVSQNFFRHGDRYVQVGNERLDKYVTEEFLTHTVYGCQVVVTNPTSARQKIDVLIQVPEGAVPVMGSKYTHSFPVDLQPYNTQSVEFHFYFPADGEFEHYPVHVSKDESLMAFAEPMRFNVVNELSNVDRESWAYVSQFGSDEQVIRFLEENNLQSLDLSKIAFRMQDKGYFQAIVGLIQDRYGFDPTLWSYGIKHNDVAVIREYLQFRDGFVNQCGLSLDSELLTIDPVLRTVYEHLEYRPLVNARAHQLGDERQILNDRFHQQYHRLMKVLSYQRELDDYGLMAVTYYMLLQDRIEEAMGFFARIDPDQLPTRIQYDYCAAYLDMFNEQPSRARQIAEQYSGHGVDRWRNAFQAILAQLDEIESGDVQVVDDENRDQTQTQLAANSPTFEFKVEAKKVILAYQNLESVEVNYYEMDIELLFSRNPFVQQRSGQFSYVRPNMTAVVELPGDANSFEFDLPAELHTSNVLVEISAAGQTKSTAYFSNSLNVQMQENYGQLRVSHDESQRPIPKTYVKAYARMKDGSVKFYKDGYTDLRGRFDYTSLSTNELDFVDRFSLLIFSEEHGAIVREAAPPQR